jgi:hypothetical protein
MTIIKGVFENDFQVFSGMAEIIACMHKVRR